MARPAGNVVMVHERQSLLGFVRYPNDMVASGDTVTFECRAAIDPGPRGVARERLESRWAPAGSRVRATATAVGSARTEDLIDAAVCVGDESSIESADGMCAGRPAEPLKFAAVFMQPAKRTEDAHRVDADDR